MGQQETLGDHRWLGLFSLLPNRFWGGPGIFDPARHIFFDKLYG